MSMFVIFPADELIEILLSNEYRTCEPLRPSPILPPGPVPTLSATSEIETENYSSFQSSEPIALRRTSTDRDSIEGESGERRRELKPPIVPPPRIRISAPPRRKLPHLARPKVLPLEISSQPSEQTWSSSPISAGSPRLKRFTFESPFERIEEEGGDDFSSFRRQNQPHLTNSGGGSGNSPKSPSPLKTNPIFKGQNPRMSSKESSGTALSSILEGLSLRDLLHPNLNESLKAHNALTFKLIRVGKPPIHNFTLTFS